MSAPASRAPVGITGAYGFLGTHVRLACRTRGVEARLAGRDTFASDEELDAFVAGVDAIVHAAGVNRGTDGEVRSGNVDAARRLADALRRAGRPVTVVYASSTQVDRDNVYGRAKAEAGRVLEETAVSAGGRFASVVLPNLFGEFGRPRYNSVVATFCDRLVHGEAPVVDRDAPLSLLHAQDAAGALLGAAAGDAVSLIPRSIGVADLAATLCEMHRQYVGGVLPSTADRFDRALFNTYRSFWPDAYRSTPTQHTDARGWLFEAVRARSEGQMFASLTRPGVVRGNHFHTRKFERFLVVQGRAIVRLRRILDGRVVTVPLDGATPSFVDIPTFTTHNIENVGDADLLTLFWTDEHFTPGDPDTYAEAV